MRLYCSALCTQDILEAAGAHAAAEEQLQPYLAPEPHAMREVHGKELPMLPVAEDSADTWLLVLQLLMRPSSAPLTWVRGPAWRPWLGTFPEIYL